MTVERGEGWELHLGTIATTRCPIRMDIRVGSERRIPNLAFRCIECSAWKHAYVKPSAKIPDFCSKSCRLRYEWRETDLYARMVCTGAENCNWKGDAAKQRSGRSRALRLYPTIGPCRKCGAKKAERHHINGNTLDNSPENIEALCRRCHMDSDGRLEASREHMRIAGKKGNAARWRK